MAKVTAAEVVLPELRQQIMATAARMTDGFDVKKKFGVTPVTYYSGRKKSGAAAKRGRRPGSSMRGGSDLTSQCAAKCEPRS